VHAQAACIERSRERQIAPPHVDHVAQRGLEEEIDIVIGRFKA